MSVSNFNLILDKIEKALEANLPSTCLSEWKEHSFGNIQEQADLYINSLIEPCISLVKSGGKRWRPLLLILCSELARETTNDSVKLNLEQTYSLTPLVEFVHTASLIHDDIEDNADTRRGRPSAHITYGLDCALNAGTWLYFQAAASIQNLDTDEKFKVKLYNLYTMELRRLHLGQAMDIVWHQNPQIIPTLEEYRIMVQNKTGTLSSLAAKIGMAAGGASSEIITKAGFIAARLGEGFQILDDVQNLTTGNPGKKRGDDIVEGKKSLPLLIHLQENPKDKEIIEEYLKKASLEGIHSPAVEECIKIISSNKAIEKAEQNGKSIILESAKQLADIFNTIDKSKNAELIVEMFEQMITGR